MHVHPLGDEDIPQQKGLVVQRPRWHGPARNPQPSENIVKPVWVELLLDTGCDIVTGGGHIIIIRPCAVGRRQKRPDLVVVERRRVVLLVVNPILG
jgi:hypothetical protein